MRTEHPRRIFRRSGAWCVPLRSVTALPKCIGKVKDLVLLTALVDDLETTLNARVDVFTDTSDDANLIAEAKNEAVLRYKQVRCNAMPLAGATGEYAGETTVNKPLLLFQYILFME